MMDAVLTLIQFVFWAAVFCSVVTGFAAWALFFTFLLKSRGDDDDQ